MNPIVEDGHSIKKHASDFGPKTTRLIPLADTDTGLPVFGVSKNRLTELCTDSLADGVATIASDILHTVPMPCIIRSSGIHEDSLEHAHAGQYRSAVALTSDNIVPALTEVLTDAREKLGTFSAFSLLIQPYKKPEYTGVFFSRDPRGGLLSMMAWSKGATPHVVSGSDSSECVFHRRNISQLPFHWMHRIVENGLKLEETYNNIPQDVEWIYDGTRIYIVQTRPITTVHPELNTLFLALEKERPSDVYLERSGAAETYPHPVPLTFSLLSYLYRTGGPIYNVYTAHKISITPTTLLTQIGTHLYTDKEAELKSIYPSHSYFGRKKIIPHIAHLKGLWKTLRNASAFARISTDESAYNKHRKDLQAILERNENATIATWEDLVSIISDTYRAVFSINMLAFVAESRLKIHLKGRESLIPLLLKEHGAHSYEVRAHYPIGNSLAIDDTTPFTRAETISATHTVMNAVHTDTTARMYGQNLARLLALREDARCASAWCAHHTRTYAMNIATRCSVPHELVPYMIFEELEAGSAVESLLRERMHYHKKTQPLLLPRILTTIPAEPDTTVRIISHGYARGLVVDKEYITAHAVTTKEYILFTPALSPDIVRYFPVLTGIIATTGSTLSHLAIMAREAGIPVVVDPHATMLTDGTYMYELDARNTPPQK